MRKYLPIAVILTYLVLLAIWVVAFISNLPASRAYVSPASTVDQNTNGSEQPSSVFATQLVDAYPNPVSSLRAVGRTIAPTGKPSNSGDNHRTPSRPTTYQSLRLDCISCYINSHHNMMPFSGRMGLQMLMLCD